MKQHPDKRKWNIIIAVLLTVLLKFAVAGKPGFSIFYITAALVFWFFFIFRRYKSDPLVLNKWGFNLQYFKKSLLYLLPFGIIVITSSLLYASLTNTSILNWHILPILILYPVWGLTQQFIVAGLVAGNLRTLVKGKITDFQVNLMVSLLFALVHYPDISLMIYVLLMELIFIHAYFKYNNLWSLGLYHGWASGFFLFFVLQRDLWNELLLIFQ